MPRATTMAFGVLKSDLVRWRKLLLPGETNAACLRRLMTTAEKNRPTRAKLAGQQCPRCKRRMLTREWGQCRWCKTDLSGQELVRAMLKG